MMHHRLTQPQPGVGKLRTVPMRAVLDDSSHEKAHLMFTSSVLRVAGAGKEQPESSDDSPNRAGEEEARLSFTNLQKVHKLAEERHQIHGIPNGRVHHIGRLAEN